MQEYKNLSGKSPVLGYEIGADFIRVQFRETGTYLYNCERPGINAVDAMKVLAVAGKGLGTYIAKHVKKRYAAKA